MARGIKSRVAITFISFLVVMLLLTYGTQDVTAILIDPSPHKIPTAPGEGEGNVIRAPAHDPSVYQLQQQGAIGSDTQPAMPQPKHHHHTGGSFSTSADPKGRGGLIQIPSNKTDYPDNDPSVVQVHVTSAKKDILGDYEIKGEITNVGNDSLQFVHITAHVYDATGQLIGSGDGYTTPSDLDTQHTGTYDIFVTKDSLSGKPAAYRLSFDWSR